MGMVSEALGLAPIGSSMVPAVFSERAPLMRRAAKNLMKAVLGDSPLPRDIVTRKALENACAVVSATSSRWNLMPASCAMAGRCSAAFVDPPVAETTAQAFSSACLLYTSDAADE